MAEKSYFEQLQEQAAAQESAAKERGPELTVGPQSFTIIGGTHGTTKDGREWSAVSARHTNGHEYRLFYSLYWPLKAGEIEPGLNVSVFNWIVAFDPTEIAKYTGTDFDNFFNKLTGRAYQINYTVNKSGKVVIDFNTPPLLLDTLESELSLDEVNFDAIK